MRAIGQACLRILLSCGSIVVVSAEEKFDFKAPVVGQGVFTEDLGLLQRERDEYATSLANYVANHVVDQKASRSSLDFARKALALALNLSSRNKRATVLKFQLAKSVMPKKAEMKYSPKTLASLFVVRAEALKEQKGEKNLLLARALLDLAVTIDPHNEDAVYAYEIQKIDQGEVQWSELTDVPPAKN